MYLFITDNSSIGVLTVKRRYYFNSGFRDLKLNYVCSDCIIFNYEFQFYENKIKLPQTMKNIVLKSSKISTLGVLTYAIQLINSLFRSPLELIEIISKSKTNLSDFSEIKLSFICRDIDDFNSKMIQKDKMKNSELAFYHKKFMELFISDDSELLTDLFSFFVELA